MKSSKHGYALWHIVRMQIEHYIHTQKLKAGFPQWYEIQRKTTHTIFWDYS